MLKIAFYAVMIMVIAVGYKPAQAHVTAQFNHVFTPIKEALSNVD